jgi:hypothetical protein
MQSTVELWRGPSLFDGGAIVLLASGLLNPSTNRKTGPMIQTWILSQDDLPMTVMQEGKDAPQCGTCPLRRKVCYVDLRPVNGIWRKWQAGDVPLWDGAAFRYPLRMGAYGDPAMVPLATWLPIIRAAPGWTGYTHQWRWCDPGWKAYMQASVETAADALVAQEAGWSTYRVALPDEPLLRREAECTYNVSSLQCWACLKCRGDTGKNIVGRVHGLSHKINGFTTLVNTLSEDSHQETVVAPGSDT